MKKILAVVLLAVLYMLLCSYGEDRTEYYEERISSYETVAQYALQNYASSDGSMACVSLSDYSSKTENM